MADRLMAVGDDLRAPAGLIVPPDRLEGSTTLGRSLLNAANQSAARSAIGAVATVNGAAPDVAGNVVVSGSAPVGDGGRMQIGGLTLPPSPQPGDPVRVVADSATVFPPDIFWDGDGAPPAVGEDTRLLVEMVWDGTTWLGTYGVPFLPQVDTTPPDWSPTFTLGTPTPNGVVVTADSLATDDSGTVAGYQVTLNSTVGSPTWSGIVPSGNNFTLTGLTAGTTYANVALRAFDTSTNFSAPVAVPSFTSAAAGALTLAYQGNASSGVDQATYTYTAQPIGSPAADRNVVVLLGARKASTSATVASVTIGGVPATIDVQRGDLGNTAAIARAVVPTGTTADVAVTFSETVLRSAIGVWSLTGNVAGVAVSSGTNSATVAASTGGATVAGFVGAGTSATEMTWGPVVDNAGIKRFDLGMGGEGANMSGADTLASGSLKFYFTTAITSPQVVAASYR